MTAPRLDAHDDGTPSRRARASVLRVKGDLVIATAPAVWRRLRGMAGRRDVETVVLDFSEAGRIDSAGVAVVSLAGRLLRRKRKALALRGLEPRHQAALELFQRDSRATEAVPAPPGFLEQLGDTVYRGAVQGRAFAALVADTGREAVAVLGRRRRMPEGAFIHQAVTIGVDALFIVGLLSFLLGMTMSFQGAVQLEKFGADVLVADLVAISMVREFAPIMTAIILTGRTGAAIAAELGTMRVRAEIDALRTMGVSPVRFLVLPRLAALTVMQPALALVAMFIGIGGGMVVAAGVMDMLPTAFWGRMIEAVTLGDFVHGVGKSVVFAWIIGFTGSFLGLSAGGDASSVGASTTRTVVVCIFLVVVVDAAFATVSTLMERP